MATEPSEPEPPDDPSALPTEEIARAASHTLRQRRLTTQNAEPFFMQALLEYQRNGISHAPRFRGTPLSAKELRARDLLPNTKVSREYYSGLNTRGRENPLGSETALLLSFNTALANRGTLFDAQRLGFGELRLSKGPDCCSKARRFPENISAAGAPDLPLLGCDAKLCACFYHINYRR